LHIAAMLSSTVVRRVAGSRILTRATVLSRRTYSTPTVAGQQEVDPQLDGYPQLPNISRQYLPAKGWEDPQERRNFGDTLHEQEELYSMWAPDIPTVAPPTALRWFMMAWSGFALFGVLTYYALTPGRPGIQRDYPYGGLVTELGGLKENQARVFESSTEEEE
jgi:NADH dehydrogenase (ubiquinone) 1 beta subcomplex subunit 8